MIKIGIIGAGYIGGVHAGLLARDGRVIVASVFDTDAGRSATLVKRAGARQAASAAELIESCDAVFVTTPNTQHADLAIAAASAGKHVFCEKPMATTLSDAQRILAAAEGSSGVFQVGFNRRFAPVYVALKELLAGEPPHSAHLKMNRGELLNPVWTGDAAVTGGFLFETTIHMFDMVRFQFGEVAEMTAIGTRHEYAETDDFSVLLRFKSGMHATMASSADATWLFPFERVEVFCHHRTIVTREMESVSYTTDVSGEHVIRSMQHMTREEKWGYAQEDAAFIDAVVRGEAAPVTAMDGYKSIELVDACYRAVASGQAVRL